MTSYLKKTYSVHVRLIEREGCQKDEYQPEVDLSHHISFLEEWKNQCDEIEKLFKDL